MIFSLFPYVPASEMEQVRVQAVEITAPEGETFHIALDGQPYGPFRRVVIGPCSALRPSAQSIAQELHRTVSGTGSLAGGNAAGGCEGNLTPLKLPVMRFLPTDL